MRMNMSDLQKKTDAELGAYIREKREELRKLRFGLAGSGMRNTHAIRNLRRELAQALTAANTRNVAS